jgi:hypothetical protein
MKEFKSNVALIGRVFYSRYSLFILNGFLLSACIFLHMQDIYEFGIVRALANNVKKEYGGYKSQDSLLLGSLRLTHFLEERRNRVFEEQEIDGMSDFIRPLTYDLMTAKGACGSYSMVLGSILHELGFKVRFAQMKVGEIWGGHIIIEAETDKGWAVLDPSFSLYFRKPDGNLASFRDVQQNWNFYKQQLPPDYIHEYSYSDVRYTNWDKIPVLLPAVRGISNLTIGKEATNQLSLRVFFIRKYRILYYLALSLYLYSWFKIVKRYTRKRTATRRAIDPRMESRKQRIYKRA